MTTKEEKKSKGMCGSIESGCAKSVGSSKNVFGGNVAVQSFNIQHLTCKKRCNSLSLQG
jgi:hypothetical protein